MQNKWLKMGCCVPTDRRGAQTEIHQTEWATNNHSKLSSEFLKLLKNIYIYRISRAYTQQSFHPQEAKQIE